MKIPTQSMLNFLCNYKATLSSSDYELCKNSYLMFGYIYLQLTDALKLESPIHVHYQKANKTCNIVKESGPETDTYIIPVLLL